MSGKGIQHLQSIIDVEPIARDSDLVPVPLGQHFRITAAGMTVIGEPSFETCEQLWTTLRTLEKALAFAIGDAILYFERRFGEKASQIVDASGLGEETCRNYRWVAEKVLPENRMLDRGLTMSHHQAVAALPAPQQVRWLKRAATGDEQGQWTVNRLKAEIREDGETVETGWFILVECSSGKRRDALQKQLELDGHQCKAHTRHGPKKEEA